MTKQSYPPRIMYIEYKGGGFRKDKFGNTILGWDTVLHGSARIGRVTFTRTGTTLNYRGKSFQSLKGSGFKANYFDVETGEQYWISGPRRDGTDRLYKSDWPVEIDEDVREEYWTEIRKKPELKMRNQTSPSSTTRPNATSLTRL
ncbi:MAG: hypothetical protein ABSG51_02665 [Terracidiphilus sp.]|jgi:hypothetical protein